MGEKKIRILRASKIVVLVARVRAVEIMCSIN